jgi:hypothetical protein
LRSSSRFAARAARQRRIAASRAIVVRSTGVSEAARAVGPIEGEEEERA